MDSPAASEASYSHSREGSQEAAGTARGSGSKFSSREKAVGEGWQVGNARPGEELLSNLGIWPPWHSGISLRLPVRLTLLLIFYPLPNRIRVYFKSQPLLQPFTRPDES